MDFLKINKRFDFKTLLVCSASINSDYTNPYLAVPLLSGQLKKAGFSTSCKDYDLEFVYDLLSEEMLEASYKKIQLNYNKFTPEFYNNAKKSGKYSDFELNSFLYKTKIYKIYQKNGFAENLYKNIKEKSKLYSKISPELIRLASLFHFIPYLYSKKDFSFNYSFIKSICYDIENNFFIDYYKKKISNLTYNPDLIIVSKMPDYHFFHFFTLCRLLKEHFKNSKIAIGGSWFSYIENSINKYPDIFDKFCDYIMVGSGEAAVVELAEYLNGERNITEVSHLIYKNSDGIVCKNDYVSDFDINDTAYADFDDFDFSKYSLGFPNVSMILSKGCYWGKCNYCSYTTANNKLQIKTIPNAIKEIKYYIDKYNIKSFLFVDDAITPAYYSKLADAIIENNIKITIESFAILDKRFTFELLSKMKKAGVDFLIFGMDTHSEKVFKIVNKSGDFHSRAEILKNVHKAGIKSKVNLIEGLPGEKFEDLLKSVKFMYDNVEYIDKYAFFKFYLDFNSNFAKYPEKFGLKVYPKEDFAFKCKFEYTDSDITNENSFYNFRETFLHTNKDYLEKKYKVYSREELRILCTEYLKKFAPDLL